MWPGQIAGLTALRQELRAVRRLVVSVALTSLVGGTAGAITLLHTSQTTFMRLVPWLFLVSTTLFAFSDAARKRLAQSSRQSRAAIGGSPSAAFLFWMTVVGFYIGYFGAGSAILIFAVFAVCENVGDLRQVNALKVLCNVVGNGISVAAFIVARAVYWKQGSIMLLASIAGGYFGGKYSRKLPSNVMRAIVIVADCSFAFYFFRKD